MVYKIISRAIICILTNNHSQLDIFPLRTTNVSRLTTRLERKYKVLLNVHTIQPLLNPKNIVHVYIHLIYMYNAHNTLIVDGFMILIKHHILYQDLQKFKG